MARWQHPDLAARLRRGPPRPSFRPFTVIYWKPRHLPASDLPPHHHYPAMKIAPPPKPCSHYGIKRHLGGVHVATSPLAAVRQTIRDYPDTGPAAFWALPKLKRRYFIACVLNAHAVNRREYRIVMARREAPLEWRYLWDGTTAVIPTHIPADADD